MSETLTLKVEGMKCSGCEHNLSTALLAVTGVASASASHVEKNVIVDYDSGMLSRSNLEQAIEQAGFSVVK